MRSDEKTSDLEKDHAEFAQHVGEKCERTKRRHCAFASAQHEPDRGKRLAIEKLVAKDQLADRRASKKRKYRDRNPYPGLRLADMVRIKNDRYGRYLPEDDAGKDELPIFLRHVALVAIERGIPIVKHMRDWRTHHAPWAADTAIEAVADEIGKLKRPAIMDAVKLGRMLNLTDADRTRLRTWTIEPVDVSRPQRAERKRQRRRQAKADKRRAAGATPQCQSLARTKPWVSEGISRSTYFDRKRRRERETETLDCFGTALLESNRSRNSPEPESHESQPWVPLGISRATFYRRKATAETRLSMARAGTGARVKRALPHDLSQIGVLR